MISLPSQQPASTWPIEDAADALRSASVIEQLIEIGTTLTSADPLADRMRAVLGQTAALLGCDRCSIMLWDGEYYRATYNFGNPPDVAARFLGYKVSPRAELVANAHRTYEVVVVNQAKEHPMLRAIAEDANIESIVIAPMRAVGGERLGFLTAEFNQNHGQFDEIQGQAANAISKLVAVALVSAQDRREREEAEEASRQVVRELALAEERERRRISIDIHDDVLQSVISIGHFLEIIGNEVEDPLLRDRLGRLQLEARWASTSLRELVDDLFPVGVDERTLVSALTGLAERRNALTYTDVTFAVSGSTPPTGAQAAVLYRIAQQSLDNVIAHALAETCTVLLDLGERTLGVRISDDGVGFARDNVAPGRIGLFAMTQRAEQIGGNCVIKSARGAGTTVRVELQR